MSDDLAGASWDLASEGYASHVAPRLMEPFMAELVERLDPDGGMRALEVAAGSGVLTVALAPRVKSLLATDFAPQMVAINKQYTEALGHSNVEFAVMDGQALQLADDTFDCAASSFGVMLFPDRVRGLSELRRVVRPEGRVLVAAWAGPDRFENFGLFLAAMARAFPDMPPPPAPPPVLSLADLNVFAAEMHAAGFDRVETATTTRVLRLDALEEFWTMLTAGAPPVQDLFDRVGAAGQERLRTALAEVVEARYGSGPIVISNTATIATGVVP